MCVQTRGTSRYAHLKDSESTYAWNMDSHGCARWCLRGNARLLELAGEGVFRFVFWLPPSIKNATAATACLVVLKITPFKRTVCPIWRTTDPAVVCNLVGYFSAGERSWPGKVQIQPASSVSFLGITADIGPRIILAPSFGISLEEMKTKIKGKAENSDEKLWHNSICLQDKIAYCIIYII